MNQWVDLTGEVLEAWEPIHYAHPVQHKPYDNQERTGSRDGYPVHESGNLDEVIKQLRLLLKEEDTP